MDLRLASLTLGTLLILVTPGPRPSVGQKVYTNTWAVHVAGGEQEADRIAKTHGFVNQGNVSTAFRHVIFVFWNGRLVFRFTVTEGGALHCTNMMNCLLSDMSLILPKTVPL